MPFMDELTFAAEAVSSYPMYTANLRDFPASRLAPHAISAQHPDDFVSDLFETDAEAVLAAVRGHRAALRNPPRSARDYLAALERLGLVRTVSLLRTRAADI